MAAEWWFYHIERGELVSAVAPLLEKCLERKWRVVVSGRPETLQGLDAALWTWRDDSFLPHALVAGAGSEDQASAQPILLSPEANPVNGARIALLLDGEDADADRFERCLVVFDGGDEPVRARARDQYRRATAQGVAARYFQQDSSGGWVEKTQSKQQG